MKYYNILPCLIFFMISNTIYADTTHVGGEMSGVLTLEGSPYIVDQATQIRILEDDTLVIEAGVEILFTPAGWINCHGSLFAYGTREDSIVFDKFNEDPWYRIIVYHEGTAYFSYCIFRNAFYANEPEAFFQAIGETTVENCYFCNLWIAIETFGREDQEKIIRSCSFADMQGAIVLNGEGEHIVDRCIFEGNGIETNSPNTLVSNCIFMDSGLGIYSTCEISQSIFIDSGIFWWDFENEFEQDIQFNIFYPETGLVIRSGNGEIEHFCILNRVNANGDSTDRYGNLFMDPELVGGDDFPDMYFLQEDSPCIDAGDPEFDFDPDGTCSDIGAFYFHQRDIEVDPDTIRFETDGTTDSAAVTIRNVGLTTLIVSAQSINPDDSPFYINDGGEIEIEPESEDTTWVWFEPGRAGEYEAVLRIESDDPDEDTLEIPIFGVSLGIADDRTTLPAEFAIVGVHPNPFNSRTTISYKLPAASHVSLALFDLSGRRVRTLIESDLRPGFHNAALSADNLTSGVYVVRLEAAGGVLSEKVILMR